MKHILWLCLASVLLGACKSEPGPTGPQGPQGDIGPAGLPGRRVTSVRQGLPGRRAQ